MVSEMRNIKFILLAITLIGYSFASNTYSGAYRDDDLSSRIALAEQVLDEKFLYFDSTMFGDLTKGEDGELVEGELSEVSNGTLSHLKKMLLISADNEKDIAVSGRSAERTANMLFIALSELKRNELKRVTVLYIGEKKYMKILRKVAKTKRVVLKYRTLPELLITEKS